MLTKDIHQLIEDPHDKDHKVVLSALGEAIVTAVGGAHLLLAQDGQAIEAFRSARAEALDAWTQDREFWDLSENSAERRDGVQVTRGWPVYFKLDEEERKEKELLGLDWHVQFPTWQGGARPTLLVQAETVADAVREVEVRWPLPAWWRTVDAEDQRVSTVHRRYPRLDGACPTP